MQATISQRALVRRGASSDDPIRLADHAPPGALRLPAIEVDVKPLPGTRARALAATSEPPSEIAGFRLTEEESTYLRQSLLPLTPREREVVIAICAGGTNEVMADRLCIALPTLRTHLMRLNQKLGTRSKGDVVRFVASSVLDGYRSGALLASGGR